MGQYYKPIFLNENNKPKASFTCYDFGSGAKLMEHSWMKNDFVRFVESCLILEPQKLVWAGDYADEEEDTNETLYSMAYENCPLITHNEDVENKYDHRFKNVAPLRFKYLVNFDKKEFVDKSKTPNNDGWQIHPLPLLTCEGNGRGGGDYRGDEKNLVGRWSRDRIGVFSKKSDIPKGFEEVVFDLEE